MANHGYIFMGVVALNVHVGTYTATVYGVAVGFSGRILQIFPISVLS